MKSKQFIASIFLSFTSLMVFSQNEGKTYKAEVAVNCLPLIAKDISQPMIMYRRYKENHAIRATAIYEVQQTKLGSSIPTSINIQDSQLTITEIIGASNALTLGAGYEWHTKGVLENKVNFYAGAEVIMGFGQIRKQKASYNYQGSNGWYEIPVDSGIVVKAGTMVRNSNIFQIGVRPLCGLNIPISKRFFTAVELITPFVFQRDNDRAINRTLWQFNFQSKLNWLIGIKF